MSTLAIKSCTIYIGGMKQDICPTAPTGDPLGDFLCFSVYGTGLAMNRLYKPLLDPFGLTYPQYLVLVALHSQDGSKVSELGERLLLESNTLTPLIKRMESAGLVTRSRDKVDERVVRVALTPKGREVVTEALTCVPAKVLEATGMSQEELGAMNRSLTKLRDALLAR